MSIDVRLATEDDLPGIVGLTRAGRERLAGWAPQWWTKGEGADELHPLWLQYLITADGPVARVVVDGDEVVGCAISNPQPGQWFVDDVAVAEGAWGAVGPVLLGAVEERPALTCVAAADGERIRAMTAAGLTRVSSYWIGDPEAGPAGSSTGLDPTEVGDVAPGPPHSFGGALDPRADGALVVASADGGIAVGSPSTMPPPVYAGGPVVIVDRVLGPDRPGLVDETSRRAAARGDVRMAVVVGAADDELAGIVASRGFERIVDVLAWPS